MRRLFLVDRQAVLRLIVFDVPIDVHHAFGLLEQIRESAGPARFFAPCSGPYTSATSVSSTGGPGGTSATLMRAP